jgi:hypothetical protein
MNARMVRPAHLGSGTLFAIALLLSEQRGVLPHRGRIEASLYQQ